MESMTFIFAIVLVALAAVGFLVWQLQQKITVLTQPQEDPTQKIMLDLIENLRREVHHSSGEQRKEMTKTLELLETKFANLNKSVDSKISENTKTLGERLDNAAKVIAELSKSQGQMKEIGEHVKSFTDFLRHSKRRGGMGEEILNDMLADALPADKFQLQHQFRTGDAVDAVVKTTNGLIPIDAKFPLENFRAYVNADNEAVREAARKEFGKDVKKHIDAIAKKYIMPDEGTTDFAIMYVPAESVHYEAAIATEELVQYARGKRVHLVSPASLFYFLRVILIAFQSQKFEENAKKVLGLIAGVKLEATKFGESVQLTAKHISNAKKNMDDTVSSWDRLEGRIDRVAEIGGESAATAVIAKKKAADNQLPLE